ncbi:MAG TPA: endonuclease [Planctomycetota bacterium]|nr:endonuclease [Planctomycetota bacterium]
MAKKKSSENRYKQLIESIFFASYRDGISEIPFHRDALVEFAKKLRIKLPDNLGDAIYSLRYRMTMPERITRTQPIGTEWIIEGRGKSQYAFKLASINRIVPNPELAAIKIPDATPEIISAYALTDEQALLAKVRYNRLLDIFLGVASYSLQSHLRTSVKNMGQIEIDEVYVAVDKRGRQYIIPVQAKGGNDRLSSVQTKQDLACCAEKFPRLICRTISAQFMEKDLIALFELARDGDEVKIVEERHYRLVPAEAISAEDLSSYDNR